MAAAACVNRGEEVALDIGRGLDRMVDRYLLICLFLAQFILTLTGVGNILVCALLGLLLCGAGLVQDSAQVDLWVLLPLTVYNLFSMASSLRADGNITEGYASIQTVLPVLYLLNACLSGEERKLLRRMCVVWAGMAALGGIAQFLQRALTRGGQRLSGVLGGPNAMGIFLVVSWFLLVRCVSEAEGRQRDLLRRLEPVILAALALTLSMGSFLALAAGMLALLLAERNGKPWSKVLLRACRMLARASLSMGTGILVYLAASRTGRPWMALFPAGYILALAALWPRVEGFLEQPRRAAVIAGMGILVALAAVAVRPSAVATFLERLEMMENALGYLGREPLLGVGPYQWRLLNLYDEDKYFNTYHIHNAFLHVGVELGLPAMAMLVLTAVRGFRKRGSAPRLGGCTAFLVHCLMDTGFLFIGLSSMALAAAAEPEQGGRRLPLVVQRGFFALMGMQFAYHLYFCIRYIG